MLLSMKKCKQKLGATWLIGSGVIFLLFLWQTIGAGLYKGIEADAWAWLTPNLVPTLTLITSVWIVDAMGKSSQRKVDGFLYKIALYMSITYLVFVFVTIIAAFANTDPTAIPLESLRNSHLWLVPINSLTTAMLGIFFVKKPVGDNGKED